MATQPLEEDSDPTYTHFAHRDEFMKLLERFIAVDVGYEASDRDDYLEGGLVQAMGDILNHYLPLPSLLDPSLDQIVPPLMDLLARYLQRIVDADEAFESAKVDATKLGRIGRMLYWVVKVRGWKAVVPHFPSAIHYLPLLITLLSPSSSPSSSTSPQKPHHPLISPQNSWELRVVLLLWLSLLLTVPFNLSALSDTSSTAPIQSTLYGIDMPAAGILFSNPTSSLAQKVTLIAIPLLFRPGKEGTYSALLLSRLYAREDTVSSLPGLLKWAGAELSEGEREGEANFVSSLLTLLAVMPTLLAARHLDILFAFEEDVLLPHLRGSRTAASSGLIRKLAIKSRGRWWVAKLGKGISEEDDMPEGIEEEIDDLMGGLGDKDTIVRYSSAKYLARITSLLPFSLQSQIIQAIISLFSGSDVEPCVCTDFGTVIDPGGSDHTGGTMGFGGLEIGKGEGRWHGVCLALAECGRRGLIEGEQVGEALEWVLKALTFDLRRASHSIGSNVRDAAAYLLWSLSRACPPQTLKQYAERMATRLICVAVFDREVGVRRAASAAFQEGVGRLGLYPEGIDVLGKTDFYSVSVRRMAFTIAAPSVAIHKVYRDAMREHLHHITLRHWDSAMRVLGSSALRRLLELDDDAAVEDSMNREISALSSLDAVNAHGALTALTQIAQLSDGNADRQETILLSLKAVRPAATVSQQGSNVLQSICELLSSSLTSDNVSNAQVQKVLSTYLELSSKRRETDVHEALADVYGRISQLHTLLADLKSSRASVKQCSALSLGRINYRLCPGSVEKAVNALLGLLDSSAKADVETRRYAIRSLADIIVQTTDYGELLVTEDKFRAIIKAFINSLEDYSTDQRGEIGSWIRLVALTALGKTVSFLASRILQNESDEGTLLDQGTFEAIIEGIVKQSVEKLEPLREEGGRVLQIFRDASAGRVWQWEGMDCLAVEIEGHMRYQEPGVWYASAIPLLKTRYRTALLAGMVQSIGSQIQSISGLALQPLLAYLPELNPDAAIGVISDLLELLSSSINQNRIFIPTTQTLLGLLDGGLMSHDSIARHPIAADKFIKILSVVTRGIGGIKSIERIAGAMKLSIAFLQFPQEAVRSKAKEAIPLFLAHRFPRIRAMTAEHLYLSLSNVDEVGDELEELLLETNWTDEAVGLADAENVVKYL